MSTLQDIDFCTIVSKKQLAFARALGDSLRAHHPASRFFVLLADQAENFFSAAREPYHLVSIDHLPLPDRNRFYFQHTMEELQSAVMPFFLGYLFEAYGVKKVISLAADTLVLTALRPLTKLLDSYSVVLAPRVTRPSPEGAAGPEELLLHQGIFNPGLLALRWGTESEALLGWWQGRVRSDCRTDAGRDPPAGERWLDLVPALFDGVFVLREAAFNIAYRNRHRHSLSWRADKPLVDGTSCFLFQFAGFDPLLPGDGRKEGGAARFFEYYARCLEQCGHPHISRWPYSFGVFGNGKEISIRARREYAQLGNLCEQFGNPFDTASAISFHRFFEERKAKEEDVHCDQRFLEYVYLLMFRRLPEPEGNTWHLQRLRQGLIDRTQLLIELYRSEEFQTRAFYREKSLSSLSAIEFVQFAYERFLARDPRPQELDAHYGTVAGDVEAREALVRELLATKEFGQKHPAALSLGLRSELAERPNHIGPRFAPR